MSKTCALVRVLGNLIGISGILKGFFGNKRKMTALYRVLVGGLIAYIVARVAYMSYRLLRFGCVKEVRKRIGESEVIEEYEPDSLDKEYYEDVD